MSAIGRQRGRPRKSEAGQDHQQAASFKEQSQRQAEEKARLDTAKLNAFTQGVELVDDVPERDPTQILEYYGLPEGEINGVAAEVYHMLIKIGIRPNPDYFYTRVPEHELSGVEPNYAKLQRKGYEVVRGTQSPSECIMRCHKRILDKIADRDMATARIQRGSISVPDADSVALTSKGMTSLEDLGGTSEINRLRIEGEL